MRVQALDTMTMREARKLYFEANGFGENGGYDEFWVDFKLGPIPMPFPNTKGRVKAVGFHDVHHVLTGYDTDIVGEFEISAWEIAAGCKGMLAAWWLNLGGMAGGLFRSPGRTFAAFVRGRRTKTTYGESLEEVLDLTVAEARARFVPKSAREATLADILLFAGFGTVGVGVGLATFAMMLPLVPFGLLSHAMRKRAAAKEARA